MDSHTRSNSRCVLHHVAAGTPAEVGSHRPASGATAAASGGEVGSRAEDGAETDEQGAAMRWAIGTATCRTAVVAAAGALVRSVGVPGWSGGGPACGAREASAERAAPSTRSATWTSKARTSAIRRSCKLGCPCNCARSQWMRSCTSSEAAASERNSLSSAWARSCHIVVSQLARVGCCGCGMLAAVEMSESTSQQGPPPLPKAATASHGGAAEPATPLLELDGRRSLPSNSAM